MLVIDCMGGIISAEINACIYFMLLSSKLLCYILIERVTSRSWIIWQSWLSMKKGMMVRCTNFLSFFSYINLGRLFLTLLPYLLKVNKASLSSQLKVFFLEISSKAFMWIKYTSSVVCYPFLIPLKMIEFKDCSSKDYKSSASIVSFFIINLIDSSLLNCWH